MSPDLILLGLLPVRLALPLVFLPLKTTTFLGFIVTTHTLLPLKLTPLTGSINLRDEMISEVLN